VLRFNFRASQPLAPLAVYLIVIAATCTIAVLRSRAMPAKPVFVVEAQPRTETAATKPYFSLSTHRTFGTKEGARLWIDYQKVDHLDFRVYRINEPAKFFAQLDDPHQMGEREKEEVVALSKTKSWLEKIGSWKRWAYAGIKDYVRAQLQHDSRTAFNHKFRAEAPSKRTPLNQADFARVPLLNPNQLVKSWREPLQPLENLYDRRMIPLGKQEAGVYLVEAVEGDLRAYTVVVVTDLAMIEKTTPHGDLMVYTVDRRTGEPRANATVEVVKGKKTIAGGTTDKEGILRTRIDLNANEAETDPATDDTDNKGYIILANQRENFAISDLESYYFGGYEDYDGEGNLRSYIYTDRPVYRPGQKVYFKGILRAVDERGRYKPVEGDSISVTIEDPNNASVFSKELPLSSRGTFNGELDISDAAPLGNYNITAEVGAGTANGSFQIAEYKKPEYKVKASAPAKFISAGSKTKFSIDARYFFGAPVANAEVKYYVYRSRYYPGWWGQGDEDETDGDSGDDENSTFYGYGSEMMQESDGKLDAQGHLDVEFQIPEASDTDPFDYSYRLNAQVTDSSRRTISGEADFVATRGDVVAHANPDRFVYNKGDVAKIQVTATDYEGRPHSARVGLKFVMRTWTKVQKDDNGYKYNDYEMNERELSSAEVTTDAHGLASYQFTINDAGSIAIKTIVTEGGKQYVSVNDYFWVSDKSLPWTDSSYYSENYESIKLVPDKKSYRPGETAHVLAILPTDNANLLVTTELTTVMSAQHVNSPGKSVMIDLPITSDYAPDVYLNVTYVKDGEMYTQQQRLSVPARDKMLNLEIISNKSEYKPRETASYTVLARNADGSPAAGAEISLGVVDEAIYSISPETAGNIRKEFYGRRYNTVETHLSIAYSFTGFAGDKPMELARNRSSYQLADFKNEGDLVQPVVRKQFKDTAFWQASAITGGDGRATVKFRLPDNLTTWRATALGVTGDTKVGVARYKVVARKDVIMRLETPRFLTQGDTATLSGVVHNYLNTSKATQISIEVSGAQLLSNDKQTVTIQKDGDQRIDWQISAPNVGQVKLLAKALTNTESDAVELTLEVVPRGLRQSQNKVFSSAGENVDETFTMDVAGNTDQQARSLRLEASPSVAGSLFGALDYLTTYPYGCTEQTMSSFLPNVIVSQALKDIRSSSVLSSNNLDKKVQKGRDRLYGFQHEDGGWGWWKNDKSDPFMTAYVVDGLTLARNAGYDVDQARIDRGRQKLAQMLLSGKTDSGENIDLESRSFMVYALEESGGADSSYLEQVFAERSNLQPYGRALLALTLKLRKDDGRAKLVADEIERSATTEGALTHWQSRRKEMLDFVAENDIEATALSLKAVARIKPNSALLGSTSRWLVANRRNGYYWDSTKDTAFAIYGLIDYLKVSKELNPDYQLEVYLNGEAVLVERVTSANQSLVVNRKGSQILNSNQIRIVKRGRGTVYFTGALNYYSGDAQVAAASSSQLSITREYLRMRVVQDGYKLKWAVEPLTGEIRSGDLIVVRLHLKGTKGRRLMIEDPIPAGAEQIDSIASLNLDYSDNTWSSWYSSREFRDQRTVFFLDYFSGQTTLQYAMQVQVPGEFVIAPARVELMYQPEIQANTSSTTMSFKERN
jgi:alpha-2-macroglobulin